MKDIKNYLIAILAGLLVLTLSTQNSQGAGTSATAKAIQYDRCISYFTETAKTSPLGFNPSYEQYWNNTLIWCGKYKP